MKAEIEFEKSSGNVFSDLELEDAAELSAKADLIIQLKRIIKSEKLTQRNAASRIQTTQPTLSKVLNGDMDRVSFDTLCVWLKRLGKRVEIKVVDETNNISKGILSNTRRPSL